MENGNTQETPLVEVRGLSRSFRRKQALDNVTLRIPRGVVYGLVGSNGAGKTTLMKHFIGALKPQRGEVRLFGMDPVREPVKVLSRIGFLSEDRDLPGWMKLRELVRYTQAFYPDWDAAYAETLRERFELDPATKIRAMSRGEKAKVGLLTALAYRPELLLLDEPSSGLDPAARRDILGAIVRTVADEGRTVVFSSHLLEEVERMANHVAMVQSGRIVLDGPLDEVKGGHVAFLVRLGEAVSQFPRMPGVLHAEGRGDEWQVICNGEADAFRGAVHEARGEVFEERMPSLEEVFLARVSPQVAS